MKTTLAIIVNFQRIKDDTVSVETAPCKTHLGDFIFYPPSNQWFFYPDTRHGINLTLLTKLSNDFLVWLNKE